MQVTDEMVNRFLAWPLPDSVCSDGCVTQRDYGKSQGWPKRGGTNLLNADEARAMLEYVLSERGVIDDLLKSFAKMPKGVLTRLKQQHDDIQRDFLTNGDLEFLYALLDELTRIKAAPQPGNGDGAIDAGSGNGADRKSDLPPPAVAARELRAGSAALKTCATSAADESSPHGTAHPFQFDKDYLSLVETLRDPVSVGRCTPLDMAANAIEELLRKLAMMTEAHEICKRCFAEAERNLSATLQIPEGWKLVPTRATEEWARDFLSGVLNEDRHTRSKIEGVEDDINNVLGVAPSYVNCMSPKDEK